MLGFLFVFEIGSQYVSLAGLELAPIILTLPPKCWGYGCAPYLAFVVFSILPVGSFNYFKCL